MNSKALVLLKSSHRSASVANETLLRRATEFALTTGNAIELVHIVYDSSLESSIFLSSDELAAAHKQVIAEETEWVARLTDELAATGVEVSHDVRWDAPRVDALLRKVVESEPGLIMKEARDETFVLGLISNLDWELIRKSPVSVWFVQGPFDPSRGVVVGIDYCSDKQDDDQATRSALDYDVFRCAREVAEAFGGSITLVHSYQLPRGISGLHAYAPIFGNSAPTLSFAAADELMHERDKQRQRVAEQHGKSISSFAAYFNHDAREVVVKEGPPARVMAEVAEDRGAGLIVMGATDLSVWERIFGQPDAEPALSQAECDLMVVRPASSEVNVRRVPPAQMAAIQGDAADVHGIGDIVADPKAHFGEPQEVLEDPRFDIAEKQKILTAWERDDYQLMVAEDEGNIGDASGSGIDRVRQALRDLAILKNPTRR